MLILRSAPASPFARKVRIAANVAGLSDRISVVETDTNDPADPLRRENPLGKIPALLLDDGTALYDSRVIVDYLDHLGGSGSLIPTGEARFPALTQQALGDGIAEAALLQVYEGRWRAADKRDAGWLAHQADKVDRSLRHAEAHLTLGNGPIHVGTIAIACALGYLDLRFAGCVARELP
jgi:glutathione S-transferase